MANFSVKRIGGIFSFRNTGDTVSVQKIEKGYNISKRNVLGHGENTVGDYCKTK